MPLHPPDRDDEPDPEPDGPVEPELPQPPRKRRPRRLRARPRELDVEQILTWADEHFARTGRWPTCHSGPVADALGETWATLNAALLRGHRGLPGGDSLARLLARRRGRRNIRGLPPLTEGLILQWADAHFRRTGRWPHSEAGPVVEAPGETWRNLQNALRLGLRSLPGGNSLARLLQAARRVRNDTHPPPLTEEDILGWADAHFQRTGAWPTQSSGAVEGAEGEVWANLDAALQAGKRGLPGGSSLAQLLAARCGTRNKKRLPPLECADILRWADAHRQATGAWPTTDSGPVAEAPGETWCGVDAALRAGMRGLPGGSSLARLLAERRGRRNRLDAPPLSVEQILAWAEAHLRRTGHWPTAHSGAIEGAAEDTWNVVDWALRRGKRGLPGGSSLYRLLLEAGLRDRLPGH